MKITSLWLQNILWKLCKHDVKMRPDKALPIIEIDGVRYHRDCLCCQRFKHTKEQHQHELGECYLLGIVTEWSCCRIFRYKTKEQMIHLGEYDKW